MAEHLNCKGVLKIGSFKVEIATYKMYLIVISYLSFFGKNIPWVKFLMFLSDVTFHTDMVWIDNKRSNKSRSNSFFLMHY